MTQSEGQGLALEQLRDIERHSGGGVKVVSVPDASTVIANLRVEVSIDCRLLPKSEDGLPLHPRERLVVHVPRDFPYKVPTLTTPHERFAGRPHVQWKRTICLYVSPETEWIPSDGMFGFVDRVWEWLRQAAVNQLDPEGAPLHPPVAYPTEDSDLVIPRVDTPHIAGRPWVGLMALVLYGSKRVDITAWHEVLAPPPTERTGLAFLLDSPFPFEYPSRVSDLFSQLQGAGIDQATILVHLEWAALHNPAGSPLYIAIGTPMRGVRGAGALSQHLSVWKLAPLVADGLRAATSRFNTNDEVRQSGEGVWKAIVEWMEVAPVTWCTVREARPEVTARRDGSSVLSVFVGKAIAIWGVGALGGHVAEMLVRAGVLKVALYDKGIVAPGLLVRQPFDDDDIGSLKVEALAARLRRIEPRLDVQVCHADILDDPLGAADWAGGADIIIDAAASIQVLAKAELVRAKGPLPSRVPIISMAVDHHAARGVVSVVGARYSGGSADALRKGMLETCRRGELKPFADAFWPHDTRSPLFQPEPGCSATTFEGSSADLQALAALMLNAAARTLVEGQGDMATIGFVAPFHDRNLDEPAATTFAFDSDFVCEDPASGYSIRIATSAWREILGWIAQARRTLGRDVETGGVLFGQHDPVARIIWVSEVIGPPPDSTASPGGFVTGVQGVREANTEKRSRSRGSVAFIGMWHTHPGGAPLPSGTDLEGMAQIVTAADSLTPKALLLIVGGKAESKPSVGSFLFSREDFVARRRGVWRRECAMRTGPLAVEPRRNVGLALSGGGARAIAFHLGCLRALEDRGILKRVSVLSTVSGGSVIGAMYAYSTDSFDDFDSRVVRLLQDGLQGRILKQALKPRHLSGVLATVATAGVAAAMARLLRHATRAASWMGLEVGANAVRQAPLRRRISRTDAFVATLQEACALRGALIQDVRRGGVDVVINATELRTGTAFRFSNRGCGATRYGQMVEPAQAVATAVAASAAYPAILPALDREFVFRQRDGVQEVKRVVLADGGIYDNLGTFCMEPGRSADISQHVFAPEYLVVCDAGVGIVPGEDTPYWWPSRMTSSLEAMFRRVQNSTRDRLHRHVESGALKGFVHSYLGMDERSLPWAPPDLVPRRTVAEYPTDFAPMAAREIDLLAARGEQLTRLLIAHYCPEL